MKKHGIAMVVVMFAVIAFAAAPSVAGMHEGKAAVRGSNLIGAQVVNRDNQEVGTVEDIIVGRNGRVNYLVIDHKGMLGRADTLIPVPYSAVDRTAERGDRIVLDASREELQNAPSFASNDWPNFSDRSYEKNVRGYYGTTPSSKNWPDFKGGAWTEGEEEKTMPGNVPEMGTREGKMDQQ